MHQGNPVCFKCLNGDPKNIFSWQGTTMCTRCLNTEGTSTSYTTPNRRKQILQKHSRTTNTTTEKRKIQSPRVLQNTYDEGKNKKKLNTHICTTYIHPIFFLFTGLFVDKGKRPTFEYHDRQHMARYPICQDIPTSFNTEGKQKRCLCALLSHL